MRVAVPPHGGLVPSGPGAARRPAVARHPRSMRPRTVHLPPPAAGRLLGGLLAALLLAGAVLSPAAAVPPRSEAAAPGAAGPPWQWPLAEPHRVVAPFDAPAGPYAAGHRGLDLAGGGGVVTAVDDGVVRFSGTVAGRGVVSILHDGGLISTYEPVSGSVQAEQLVAAGAPIGQLDPTVGSHCAGVTCLHLGARRGDAYLDPMLLLAGRGPSVLLPLAGTPGHGDAGHSDAGVVGARDGGRAPADARSAAWRDAAAPLVRGAERSAAWGPATPR